MRSLYKAENRLTCMDQFVPILMSFMLDEVAEWLEEIIIMMSLFKEDDIFRVSTNLTYDPHKTLNEHNIYILDLDSPSFCIRTFWHCISTIFPCKSHNCPSLFI